MQRHSEDRNFKRGLFWGGPKLLIPGRERRAGPLSSCTHALLHAHVQDRIQCVGFQFRMNVRQVWPRQTVASVTKNDPGLQAQRTAGVVCRQSTPIQSLLTPLTTRQAVGQAAHEFYRESFMDELAHAAGRDPYRYRRGRWEGDTLVVDTTNMNGKTWLNEVGEIVSHAEHIVERFTPVDADTITYRATITDPVVYSRPWTIEIQLRRQQDELLEVACHEDNGDLQHLKEVRDAARAQRNKEK